MTGALRLLPWYFQTLPAHALEPPSKLAQAPPGRAPAPRAYLDVLDLDLRVVADLHFAHRRVVKQRREQRLGTCALSQLARQCRAARA